MKEYQDISLIKNGEVHKLKVKITDDDGYRVFRVHYSKDFRQGLPLLSVEFIQQLSTIHFPAGSIGFRHQHYKCEQTEAILQALTNNQRLLN